MQAAINAASASAFGAKAKQAYIPTPDVVKAQGVKYDDLYPKVFREPATYIRFSSTVEDCTGSPYCMDEADAEFLSQLNDGKDVNGQALKDKSSQCSEDTFEEVISFFEESSQRIQPFANLDSAPVLSLEEMEQGREEPLSSDAQRFLKPLYQYWVSKKSGRPLMPTIKVRVLDTTSEADDADPYVCFRRREVRQTRKTRGRDAQVVEKLKKLRVELEQAREMVQLVSKREDTNRRSLEINRSVFNQRKRLKEVKVTQNIVGEKGEDEELLVNQRVRVLHIPIVKCIADRRQPQPKPKAGQQRPVLRLNAGSRLDRSSAPEHDLQLLSDWQNQADEHVQNTIDSRKEQHRRWNQHWEDKTWGPLTPPADTDSVPSWAPLFPSPAAYPTPPPSLPSRSSQDRDGDIDMVDQKPVLGEDATAGAAPHFSFFYPPCSPAHDSSDEEDAFANGPAEKRRRIGNPPVRLRIGRGGRMHLEMRKHKPRGFICRGVVSDAESDDEREAYFIPPETKTFDYRCALNNRAQRPEGQHAQRLSGDQTAMIAQAQAQAQAAARAGQASSPPQIQVTAGSSG